MKKSYPHWSRILVIRVAIGAPGLTFTLTGTYPFFFDYNRNGNATPSATAQLTVTDRGTAAATQNGPSFKAN